MITHTHTVRVSLLYSSSFHLLLLALLLSTSSIADPNPRCIRRIVISLVLSYVLFTGLECFIFSCFIILHPPGSCGRLYWKCLESVISQKKEGLQIIIVYELGVFGPK